MVERAYKCDLCSVSVTPPDARLVGFKWEGAGGGTRISYAPARQVEKHICIDCLAGMARLADEARRNGHGVPK